MAKTRFWTLANPTLKTFLGGSTRGRWCKCNADGPHGCVGHADKWSEIRLECPQVPPTRRNEKSSFFTKSPNRATQEVNGPQQCDKCARIWSRKPRKRETGPVGRSSKNGKFVTKNSTKFLKIERGVLKKETAIFGRIGTPQAQLASPIASANLKLGAEAQTTWEFNASSQNLSKVPKVVGTPWKRH